MSSGTFVNTIFAESGAVSSYSVINFHKEGLLAAIDSNQVVVPSPFGQFTEQLGSWQYTDDFGRWEGVAIDFTAAPNPDGTGQTARTSYVGRFSECNRCEGGYNRVVAELTVDIFNNAPDAVSGGTPLVTLGPFRLEGRRLSPDVEQPLNNLAAKAGKLNLKPSQRVAAIARASGKKAAK